MNTNFRITSLGNGIKVVSEYVSYVQSFSLGFWVNVGSQNESKKNNGITHFIEHMVFKGTKTRSAKKISDEVESLGGYLNAFTSKEHTCFYGRGLSGHIEKTFEVIADMIQNPKFDEKDIKNEAGVVIDELFDIEDTPEELIFDRFEANVYKGSPLALPIIGEEKNISGFTKNDLFEYVHKHYRNNNLLIVAAGNINHDDLLRYLDKYFTTSGNKIKSKKPTLKVQKVEPLVIEKDIQQTHVVMGVPAPGFNNERRIAAGLLSHVLGEGSSSRLFQILREKNGIAYQINSFLNSFYEVSTLGVYFSTSEKQIEKSMRIINKELRRIKESKVSQKELDRAKEYIKGNLLMSLESTTSKMMRMGNSMLYYNRLKSVEESIAEVEKVTAKDVIEEANLLFDFGKMNIVLLGSKKRFIVLN